MREKKEIIRFQVSSHDKAEIEAAAKKLRLSISAFMRLLFQCWSNGKSGKARV